jgi:uncharacterized protein (DUF1330 family)
VKICSSKRETNIETFIHPSEASINAVKDLDSDDAIVMLNLLRFRPGGAEQYAEYVAAATPFLQRAGAEVVYRGDVRITVIGDDEWHQTILVRYPSKRHFLKMLGEPDYPVALRGEAILDSRLYLTIAGH